MVSQALIGTTLNNPIGYDYRGFRKYATIPLAAGEIGIDLTNCQFGSVNELSYLSFVGEHGSEGKNAINIGSGASMAESFQLHFHHIDMQNLDRGIEVHESIWSSRLESINANNVLGSALYFEPPIGSPTLSVEHLLVQNNYGGVAGNNNSEARVFLVSQGSWSGGTWNMQSFSGTAVTNSGGGYGTIRVLYVEGWLGGAPLISNQGRIDFDIIEVSLDASVDPTVPQKIWDDGVPAGSSPNLITCKELRLKGGFALASGQTGTTSFTYDRMISL